MAPGQESGTRGGQYRFGEFTLDTARGELLSGEEPVRLRPQSYEVLLLLVSHAGELLSKDFIHEKIWANRAVTDDSLTQCLIDIRRAIGDADRSIVRTVPRRGYMFTAEVDNPATSAPATGARRMAPVAIVTVGVLAAILVGWILSQRAPPAPAMLSNSVAVLPFVDRSASQNQQYLGDGLSEDILSRLGHVPELRVIARTSSFALASESPDVASLRDQLRVAYVVEGSVGREGDRVRVTARLIETENSTNVWNQTFEVTRGQLATVQEAIAVAILERILPGQDTAIISPAPRIGSVSEAMLLGRHYENEIRNQQEVDGAMLGRAIELYRDVVAAEPDSALARSRLAGVLLWQGDIRAASDEVFRALTLDPELSEVLEVLGRYYWATNLIDEAGDAWQKAMALNPSNVDALSHFATYSFRRRGEYVVAEELYRRAVQLDPLNLSRYADLGHLLAVQEKTGQTEAIVREVQERFDGPDAYNLIAHLFDYLGRLDESIAWVAAARDSDPDAGLHVEYLAELLVDIGDFEAALAVQPEPGIGVLLKMRRYDDVIDEAALLMLDQPGDVSLRYVLAFAYNAADRPEDALRILAGLDMLRPEIPNNRRTTDLEAKFTAADALLATGEVARAREIAGLFNKSLHDELGNWWRPLYRGCASSILGNEDDALARLKRVADSPRLPWTYLVRDMHCFRQLAGRDEYQQVLQRIEARQAGLRQRLPETLQEFGVTL